MTQITSTDAKTEFLKTHMLRPFSYKWENFSINVSRFGEKQVLDDYANVLAGKGYTAAQLKKGIQDALRSSICPDPMALLKIIEAVNKTDKEKETEKDPFRYTMEDKLIHRAMMQVVRSKSKSVSELVRKTMPEVGSNNPNARQIFSSYIDQVAETIKQGGI